MAKHVKIVVFFIIALVKELFLHATEAKSPEYLKYVHEIVENFAKEMKNKYKLHCYGSGGNMPTDVEKIDVCFLSYNKSTVEDARKMEVIAIEDILQRINHHEKIRPYLREYPFNAERIGISISFRTETDDRPLDGSIAYVSLGKGKIFYYTSELKMSDPMPLTRIDKNNKWTKERKPGSLHEELIPLLEETYEEALKIIGTTL